MKKVKITILKTMLNEDLAKEYGICGLKACPNKSEPKECPSDRNLQRKIKKIINMKNKHIIYQVIIYHFYLFILFYY